MKLSRRGFLAASAAFACSSTVAATRGPDIPELRAVPGSMQLASAQDPDTAVWTFGGSVPGPELRVRQGERVVRRLVNELPQPTSIHWHGVRIRNDMDGVPGLTQDAVPPGGTFDYDFVAPDAGTFWYHSHEGSSEQVGRGLYGPLVVEEREPPTVDADRVLMLDDWRLADDFGIHESFGWMADASHAGRIGNWVTVNGLSDWRSTARQWARLRLRLVNAANARIFDLGFRGFEGWMVALDGQPLEDLDPIERVSLAPGQRADVMVDVTAEPESEAFVVSFEGEATYAAATWWIDPPVRRSRAPQPSPLPANPLPSPSGFATARIETLRMEGGAMGGMRAARLAGRELGIRGLVDAGYVWSMNGAVDLDQEPMFSAGVGEAVRLRILNETAWPHVMHIHGHHFQRLHPDGGRGPWRDGVLLEAFETVVVGFVADNPGDWLLHCHMLEHASSGMRARFRVFG